MSKKMVFKMSMDNGRSKTKAMKAVAGSGVDSVEVDMAEGKLTAVGDADPVYVAKILRKMGYRAELLSVGPAKEEKEEEEKEEESSTVVYHMNPSAYAGYPSYAVVRDEYSSGWTIF